MTGVAMAGIGLLGVWPGGAAAAPQRVPIAAFDPLPAMPTVSPEAAALRADLLGEHAGQPGWVTLHWTGVSSFIVTVNQHLFLFDAWEIIGAVNDYLPLGREELAALEPEAILIGHGHFDHAADAGYVAGLSGAVVVGSEEICTVAEQTAVREGVPDDFRCAITGTMTEPPMGTMQTLQLFADLAPVSILQHVHSAATEPGPDNEPNPSAPIMDPQPYIDHFQDDPEELARFLAQQQESNQGGTWLYHLVVGDFTLVLGDSAGPIFQSQAIRDALDRFPGCVDVLANAILGFDQPVSGLQDPRLYVEHAHPKVFIPTHADAWAPVISAGQAQYVDLMEAELATLPNPPETIWLLDPDDYLAEVAFDVTDSRWTEPHPGSSCAAAVGPDAVVPEPDADAVPLPATGGAAVALLGLAGLAIWTLGRRQRRA